MKANYFFFILFTVLQITISQSQSIVGFWEIKEVKIGTQTMTPVAKWTKINKDGSYQSGNGWLQNAEGNWTFDKERSLFSPTEANGLVDEFGPFTVEFTNTGMNWLREEKGMIVTVTLEKIEEMPKSTADKVVGLWNLESILKSGDTISTTDNPEIKQNIFIRWDRIYMKRTSKGKRFTGYWHIHGHKAEITFLPHSKDKNAESWLVEVSGSKLKLIGISDSNKSIEMTYNRLHQFPK